MLIIPHQLFDVVMGKGGLLKFVPNAVVLQWVKSQLNCTSISIHSYIKRHIKQIGLKEQIVLIPRVVTKGARPDRAPNLGLVERFNFGLLPRFNLSLVAHFNFGLPYII